MNSDEDEEREAQEWGDQALKLSEAMIQTVAWYHRDDLDRDPSLFPMAIMLMAARLLGECAANPACEVSLDRATKMFKNAAQGFCDAAAPKLN